MNTEVYNVIGPEQKLKLLLLEFPNIRIEERFTPVDWNIVVPYEEVDNLIDFCEDNAIECKMV